MLTKSSTVSTHEDPRFKVVSNRKMKRKQCGNGKQTRLKPDKIGTYRGKNWSDHNDKAEDLGTAVDLGRTLQSNLIGPAPLRIGTPEL
uniref:Transposase n=1 Tax=Steinernema glaseri TaxID=37863 RepID=A0A1I7Z1L5_9BILA